MYNSVDKNWRNQPVLMSEKIVYQTCLRIIEHCNRHNLKKIEIVLHGGEPLLGGYSHLVMITSTIDEMFRNTGIEVKLHMQSNGILFSAELGDLMLKRNISLGISIDGPPEVNDLHRIDHFGKPSSKVLEEKLKLIVSPSYRKIFQGFLSVIDITSDPIFVFKYLLAFKPPVIDFLLPDNNHDNLPPGKKQDVENTAYGDWLIQIYNYWYEHPCDTKIRLFDNITRQLFGLGSDIESIGSGPIRFVVIETNGDIEALDVLKTSYDGATKLGYNIFKNDLDSVTQNAFIRFRQLGNEQLCDKCRSCAVVRVCGGGYFPHRYSSRNGYINPSIYCTDLQKTIEHIQEVVQCNLKSLK